MQTAIQPGTAPAALPNAAGVRRDCSPANPGVPLKRGQRLPTPADIDAAQQERLRGINAGFSLGARWEITPDNVRQWLKHNFASLRGNSDYFRSGVDPGSGEMALLLWDLDLCRGLGGAAGAEQLRPGREDWGWLGPLMRAWNLLQEAERENRSLHEVILRRDGEVDQATLSALWELAGLPAEACPTPDQLNTDSPFPAFLDAPEATAADYRDWALYLLMDEHGISATFLAAMHVQDVDLELGSLRVDGEWQPVGEATMFAVEAYLDERLSPEPEEPLFRGERGPLGARGIRHAVEGMRLREGAARG
jgi:hypothetical protein